MGRGRPRGGLPKASETHVGHLQIVCKAWVKRCHLHLRVSKIFDSGEFKQVSGGTLGQVVGKGVHLALSKKFARPGIALRKTAALGNCFKLFVGEVDGTVF